ncbi:thiol-disulfide isomerase/thioredoxin [Seonamhaeicola aphaedonensis]|uniref:Thiol-disulfide isomerase/thioredoxin n=1 Tax=Seonamhaeicola aphaedonensis TaxID=1461338 RepID=A0A3D9HH61_9FLAO|nr:thiol-disulfide isomerase/thioredoxin [Seonamhaeicola aphaedonensis]
MFISIFSCQEKKTKNSSEISIAKEEKIEKRNEVYISVYDTISSFFTNLKLDEMQDMPNMLYLGQKEDRTSITIPTENSISITGFDLINSIFYSLKLEKGDSLLVNTRNISVNESKKAEYPIFNIPNSAKTWSEINLDYILYKKNIKTRAIVIDEEEKFGGNTLDLEKIYFNSITILDSLKSSNRISNEFYLKNKINQKLKFATSKLRKAKNQNTELDIDSLGIKINDEELLNNETYLSFLKNLILYKYFRKNKRVKYSIQFDFVNEQETFLSEAGKQILLDSYLKGIYFTEKAKFDKYLTKFNEVNDNQEFKNKWRSLVTKQKANRDKLNASNKTIGILTNLINDNQLTFEEVLSNYKGKVVLVDFWASWCAPCRKEMPHLKDLKSKFNENELKVIEISIDKDFSAWVRALKLEKISNEKDSYIIGNWEKSSLYKNYGIKTIPRYLLFGKDGKIIDENAPRPSQLELTELIKASI